MIGGSCYFPFAQYDAAPNPVIDPHEVTWAMPVMEERNYVHLSLSYRYKVI